MGKQKWYQAEINIGRVPVVDVVMMTKHFSVMLNAGLTVPESLEVLVEQSGGRMRSALARVLKRVGRGSSLGAAVAMEPKVFSSVYASAIMIGESSGTLSENLLKLAEQMEKDLALRRNVQAALLYPTIVLTAATVLALAVATFVLPQIVGIFSSLRVELPITTRILIWIAELFADYGYWISGSVIALAVFSVWFFRQKFMRPSVHRIVLRIPILGRFMHATSRARFCRTIGTLLESGTPIEEALEIAARVSPNYVYRSAAENVRKKIGSGSNFADILAKYPKLFPKIVVRMASVGEESGSLGPTMIYLADYYEETVQNISKNLSTLIEPILLISIGLVVGLLAISILTPIYSITSNIQI